MGDTFSLAAWKSALLRGGLTVEHESDDELVFAREHIAAFRPSHLGATPRDHHRYDTGGGRFVSVVRVKKASQGVSLRELSSALAAVGLSPPTVHKLLVEPPFRALRAS